MRFTGACYIALTEASVLLGFFGHYCASLKILHVYPSFAQSHLLFNYRLATLLQSLGHNVSLLCEHVSMAEKGSYFKEPPGMPVYHVPAGDIIHFGDAAFNDPGLSAFTAMFAWMNDNRVKTCEGILSDEKLLSKLEDERFDVVLTPTYHYCPTAIWKERLKIDKIVWLSGGMYILGAVADSAFLPYPSAFVPDPLSKFSDRMSFLERAKNLLTSVAFALISYLPIGYDNFHVSGVRLEETIVKQRNVVTSKNAEQSLCEFISTQTSAVFLSGESILEFPRPLSHDFFYLGNVEPNNEAVLKPLPKELTDFINVPSKGVILFSLGSVANTSLMPITWKKAFLDSFEKLREYRIIWRFHAALPEAQNYSHIKMIKWLPQKELLALPSLKLFITHGGYNSFLETVHAAKPAIMIPLFADQLGNAERAARFGMAAVLQKSEISTHSVSRAINDVLSNEKYAKNAKKLSTMILDKPVASEFALRHFLNRLAKHNNIPRLMPQAAKLSLAQYHCLDIIVTVFAVVSLLAWLMVRSVTLL